jgi:hypothetical protein
MSSVAITSLLEARKSANEWLINNLPDRFAAGIPSHDEKTGAWRVPVWLSYPQLEPLGPVGEIVLDEVTGDVREHTAAEIMKNSALDLYNRHRDQIEAPLP